jgi:hypothetical protein
METTTQERAQTGNGVVNAQLNLPGGGDAETGELCL